MYKDCGKLTGLKTNGPIVFFSLELSSLSRYPPSNNSSNVCIPKNVVNCQNMPLRIELLKL